MKLTYWSLVLLLLSTFNLFSYQRLARPAESGDSSAMMIRIAEITVDSIYLAEYLSILREEARASVRKEPGVLAIYPMHRKTEPTKISILEIYADRAAYESHLTTPHFQHYKTATLPMVRSLELIDMDAIDVQTMTGIFRKIE